MERSIVRAGSFAVQLGLVGLVGLLGACDSDDPPAAPADAGDETPPSEACPPDTPAFNFGPTGLTSEPNEALGIRAHLVEASAKPPANGYNDWTVEITDLDGNALPDASLVWTCAFMPAHGHGSNPKSVTKLGDGRFQLLRQNMAMAGGWLIELWVDPTGEADNYQGRGTSLIPDACSKPGTDASLVLKACVPS
jgi:hypothetical protein